jgi:hypothetical protein
MSSITILSFVGRSDIAKVNAYCKAEQIAKNECELDFIESNHKTLKTRIEGLGKITGMDYIMEICANICCVITALFDIQPGNPVPLLYQVSIETIGFIKRMKGRACHNYHYFFNAASSFGSAGKIFDQFGQAII